MTEISKAAQQALDALIYHVEQTRPIERTTQAITALRAALQDKAGGVREPTLWISQKDLDRLKVTTVFRPLVSTFKPLNDGEIPLFAAHPAPVVPDDHPLVVFAKECELGTYMEHETPMAARKAISAAKAIGITAKADTVAPDVARYRAIRNGLVYIEPHESGEIYVAGEAGVYTKSGDEFDAAIDAIATSQQKGWSSG